MNQVCVPIVYNVHTMLERLGAWLAECGADWVSAVQGITSGAAAQRSGLEDGSASCAG